MNRLVPLIGYKFAENGDDFNTREERENESRERHWALVHWRDTEGHLHTAEFCVITESMPDFCGGMLVYSPRVDVWNEEGWGEHFCNPCTGNEGRPNDPITTWKGFTPDMAIDLAAWTGKPSWTTDEVREYGMQCIVGKVTGLMISSGRRSFMGADHTRGNVEQLLETAVAMGEYVSWPTYHLHTTKISDKMGSLSISRSHASTLATMSPTSGNTWKNSNSGNDVRWVSGKVEALIEGNSSVTCEDCGHDFEFEGEDCCPDCGYGGNSLEFKTKIQRLSVKEQEHLQSANYRVRARRYYWRNG